MRIRMRMKKVLILAAFLLFVSAVGSSASAPWAAFGNAQSVKTGQGPNPWAVELSSLCPGGPGVCFANGTFTFSGVRFIEPSVNLLFGLITEFSTDYNVTDDDCGGGAPRFQVRLDLNGNGVSDPFPTDGNIFVYLGPVPNFTGCLAGWQSSGNLIGALDTRYDLTQVGGAFYDTYATALALHAGKLVLGVSLVVDGGWSQLDGEQTVWVDNVTVNNHQLSAQGFRK